MDYRAAAVEALEAQGFTAPGPGLITRVADALATQDEGIPASARRHHAFDYREVLRDTPELRDRLPQHRDLGTAVSLALAEVLNAARARSDGP